MMRIENGDEVGVCKIHMKHSLKEMKKEGKKNISLPNWPNNYNSIQRIFGNKRFFGNNDPFRNANHALSDVWSDGY